MGKHRFRLAGKELELSKGDVEGALEHVAPEEVRKYCVAVHGRRYPVKQALAAATGVSTDRFISTDAARILRSVGFEVDRAGERPKPAKTESELLFEEYLKSNALGFYEFEPEISGSSTKPDYLLRIGDSPVLFEVKEFRPDPALFLNLTGGCYDPYHLIRGKIEAARKKFKDLEQLACSLVLCNFGHPFVSLSSWEIVYGAMLGNLGIQFPVDMETGRGDPERARRGFFGGGKMLRYANGEAVAPQNTTISAIIALHHFPLGMRRLSMHVDKVKAASGRDLTIEEVWKICGEARGTPLDASLRQLRVVVHENPFARKALTTDLFCGQFDERYGVSDGLLKRVFAGQGILNLEADEKSARAQA
ncbi:MAG: hypothetical protein ACRD50_07870 [Candidatus Acidiferrales bacterium]